MTMTMSRKTELGRLSCLGRVVGDRDRLQRLHHQNAVPSNHGSSQRLGLLAVGEVHCSMIDKMMMFGDENMSPLWQRKC